jgi:hypothetical protein
VLKSLFSRRPAIDPLQLPQPNTFVEVLVSGRAARSVTVESCSSKGIVTRDVLGRVGEPATFVYSTDSGKFRLQTKVTAIVQSTTQFEFPKRVELVAAAGGAQKRSSVRLDTLVSGVWRFAPGGRGSGEFARATLQDISRGGCALNIDRGLKLGTVVEIQFRLSETTPPISVLGEVVRHQEIARTGKHSHGLRFHGVRPEDDHAIIDFINRKHADLRSRGLA